MDFGHLQRIERILMCGMKTLQRIFVPCNLTNRCFDSFREDKVTLMTTNKSVVKQDTELAREWLQFDFRYMNPKCVCDED